MTLVKSNLESGPETETLIMVFLFLRKGPGADGPHGPYHQVLNYHQFIPSNFQAVGTVRLVPLVCT